MNTYLPVPIYTYPHRDAKHTNMKTCCYYLSPLALVLLASGIAAQSLSDLPDCGVSFFFFFFNIHPISHYFWLIYQNTSILSLLPYSPPPPSPPKRDMNKK